MSRTVSSDRQTLVPSFPLLPLERLAYSIATKRSLSREFFNGIGRTETIAADAVRPTSDLTSPQSRRLTNVLFDESLRDRHDSWRRIRCVFFDASWRAVQAFTFHHFASQRKQCQSAGDSQ